MRVAENSMLLVVGLCATILVGVAYRSAEAACGRSMIEPGRADALAPIERADVLVRESAPPQYALRIVSGLPNGCAQYNRTEIERHEHRIDVKVWNTVPADSTLACTMVYGTADHSTNLGSEFESGTTYEVYVNDELKTTFTAQ